MIRGPIFMWLLAAVIVGSKYITSMQKKINQKYSLFTTAKIYFEKNNIHMCSGIKSKYLRGIRDYCLTAFLNQP